MNAFRGPVPMAPAVAGFAGGNPYRAVQGMRGAMNVQRAAPFAPGSGLPLGSTPQAPRLPVLESVPMPQRQGIGNPSAIQGLPPILTPQAGAQRPTDAIPSVISGPVQVPTPQFNPANSPVDAVVGSQSRAPVGNMSPTWNQGALTSSSPMVSTASQAPTASTPQDKLVAALSSRPATTVGSAMSAVTSRNDNTGTMASDWNQGSVGVAYSDITADPQRALDRILGRRSI